MRSLWSRLCRHLAKWRKRLTTIKEMRVDGFEVFDFALMLCFFIYFCTSWFTGPYTIALKHALPLWVWLATTGTTGLLTAWGFLEENFTARRVGSAMTALFLWTLGVASAVNWPHWFIGFLFCLISPIPAWLCSQFAVYHIQDNLRIDEAEEFIIAERDPPIVKLPRRA